MTHQPEHKHVVHMTNCENLECTSGYKLHFVLIGGVCQLGNASCLDTAIESDERFCTRDEGVTSRVEDRDVIVKRTVNKAVQWMRFAYANGSKFEGRPHRLTDFDVLLVGVWWRKRR